MVKLGMKVLNDAFNSVGITAGSMKYQTETFLRPRFVKRVHETVYILSSQGAGRIIGLLQESRCVKDNYAAAAAL